MRPKNRMQHYRSTPQMRRFVKEHDVTLKDLIMPVFINERIEGIKAITSLPGINQHSLPALFDEVSEIVKAGIGAVILFGIPKDKDEIGSEAFNKVGVIQRAIRLIKEHFPTLIVIADCCLCEYTENGQCGIMKKDTLDTQRTLNSLQKIAVSYAQAGVDIIAPSGMIDGMVSAIRSALDVEGYDEISIMSYSAKFASHFYGPFREAVESDTFKGDRRHHQLAPSQKKEAIREAEMDIQEGTDFIIVKPALAYLDIIRDISNSYPYPVLAYHVSGEYAMINNAARMGMIDEQSAMEEIFVSMKRAGATRIISYYAKQYATLIRTL